MQEENVFRPWKCREMKGDLERGAGQSLGDGEKTKRDEMKTSAAQKNNSNKMT